MEPEAEALWRFSAGFYALPTVAAALIALQDREGLDVNLMLFGLWIGVSRSRRLSDAELKLADRTVAGVRTDVVQPLRALRRRLRHHADADVQRLREGVMALELAGEKLVQTRLARIAGPPGEAASKAARVGVAQDNLARYLGPERARGAEAAALRQAIAAFMREN